MTRDELSEIVCQELLETVDKRTLDEGLSLRDTARIYRDIAAACRDRADGLDDEAEQHEG